MPSEPPEIAVIILTINQKEKTLRCLESFRAVKGPPHRIFLWDNGSSDGTLDAVGARYSDVICAGSPENLGVASGRNAASDLAIATIDPAYLFFIDNDMTVSSGFLSKLFAPFAEDRRLAITTGKIACQSDDGDNATGQRVIYGAGGCQVSFWRGDTSHIGYGEVDKGQYDQPGECIVSGGCMLVRSSVFRELGGFDPLFDPYGPEDLDFGLRAREKGFYGRYVPDALVWHDTRPGRSFESGQYTEKYAANRMRTWLLFMGRHASLMEKLGFYLIGGPYRLIHLIIREGRQGNFNALKGLAHGFVGGRKPRV